MNLMKPLQSRRMEITYVLYGVHGVETFLI